MSTDQEVREYVVRALEELGLPCPQKYRDLLARTPAIKLIDGLDPWFFPPNPENSVAYCSEAIGRPVLPFAQAVEEDMMACFLVEPSTNLKVIVINPWAEKKEDVALAELSNFDAWLTYAEQVSHAVRRREEEESSED